MVPRRSQYVQLEVIQNLASLKPCKKSRDLNQQVERCGNLELLAVRRVKSYIQRSL
jgi:hypothetical protein